MTYNDSIARQWHQATGYRGGEFKRLVLNDVLCEEQSIYPTKKVINAKPGLQNAGNIPLALMFRCVK
jgi:hypothetical protein